jgi:hypothetical protein
LAPALSAAGLAPTEGDEVRARTGSFNNQAAELLNSANMGSGTEEELK